MVLTILQAQRLINWFKYLNTNQTIQTADVHYVISLFEGNTNPRGPKGIKLYFQTNKEIDKETDKLDISVSNTKNIVNYFLSLSKKYGWGRLAFMLGTASGANNIFREVEQIQLEEIKNQTHGYFGLTGVVNVVAPLPNHLTVSALIHLSDGTETKEIEIQNVFDRVCSDIIAKAIEGSIYKTSLKKLRLHCGYMDVQMMGRSKGMMDPLCLT